MKRFHLVVGVLLLGQVGCGDDSSSDSSTTVSSSGAGAGGASGACGTECAGTACNDMPPDMSCGDCIEAECDAEIGACLADSGGMCGAADCSHCGALLACDECGDQGALAPSAKELFDAIMTCACGGS